MTSLVSAFFSSYSPCGSLSRSTVQQVVGGKTQLVGIISSVIILAVILSIAPLFEHLPKVGAWTHTTHTHTHTHTMRCSQWM